MSDEFQRYPVQPVSEDSDPRFSIGLISDVAEVFARHGYPKVRASGDVARLYHTVWAFLYRHDEDGRRF
ncbi:hypothetical protein SAMN06265360_12015 [Haloechinothrix alba]|uniref:Uncharacterized protein n=1 Tax=Haloechinothrix alba TaxID=664784 RepID=A0A238ZA44_9PSEU|nr:hypothetical protein [Haloechinothrix alba]SNR79939.1 hypothetical protein SAMN06265360_12015 [Haloechinothrix alba]